MRKKKTTTKSFSHNTTKKKSANYWMMNDDLHRIYQSFLSASLTWVQPASRARCNKPFSIWPVRVAMAYWNLFTRWCKNYDLARLVRNEFSRGSEEESRKKSFSSALIVSHSIITTTMKERIKSAPSLDSLEEPAWWCIIIKSSFILFFSGWEDEDDDIYVKWEENISLFKNVIKFILKELHKIWLLLFINVDMNHK